MLWTGKLCPTRSDITSKTLLQTAASLQLRTRMCYLINTMAPFLKTVFRSLLLKSCIQILNPKVFFLASLNVDIPLVSGFQTVCSKETNNGEQHFF